MADGKIQKKKQKTKTKQKHYFYSWTHIVWKYMYSSLAVFIYACPSFLDLTPYLLESVSSKKKKNPLSFFFYIFGWIILETEWENV